MQYSEELAKIQIELSSEKESNLRIGDQLHLHRQISDALQQKCDSLVEIVRKRDEDLMFRSADIKKLQLELKLYEDHENHDKLKITLKTKEDELKSYQKQLHRLQEELDDKSDQVANLNDCLLIMQQKKEKQYMTPEQISEVEQHLNLLSNEKNFGESELRKLREENLKLVGQQNTKQRIHYHSQVKEENLQLKQERLALEAKLQKAESQLKKLSLDANKENLPVNKFRLSSSDNLTKVTTATNTSLTKKRTPLGPTNGNKPLKK